MPERVTIEEKIIELAILKAKEVKDLLQDEGTTTFELDEPLTGEEVKIKKPKKNPKEEKINNPVDKDTGYGIAGQENDYTVKKMITIRKGLTKIIKDIKEKDLDSDELSTFSNQIGREGSKWGRGILLQIQKIEKEMIKLEKDFSTQKINQDDFQNDFQELMTSLREVMEADIPKEE